jgi:Fic family protein
LVDGLDLSRQTASKYLKELATLGVLEEIQIKNTKYFINKKLFNRLKKGI